MFFQEIYHDFKKLVSNFFFVIQSIYNRLAIYNHMIEKIK